MHTHTNKTKISYLSKDYLVIILLLAPRAEINFPPTKLPSNVSLTHKCRFKQVTLAQLEHLVSAFKDLKLRARPSQNGSSSLGLLLSWHDVVAALPFSLEGDLKEVEIGEG